MTVELIKDLLMIDQTIKKDQIQSLVEGEILLPDNKPNINKILTIDGDARITETRFVKDKLIINGVVDFKILYLSNDENQTIQSFNASTDFEEEMIVKEVSEQTNVDLKSYIEHIDYRLLEGTKVSVKTVINIDTKIQSQDSIDVAKEIRGTEGIEMLKDSIKYDYIVGANSSSTIVREAFEIDENMPDIIDILRVDVKTYERETTVVEGRIIVAGVVECSIMYFGDDEDNKINYLRREIPFTHFVEISNAQREMMSRIKILVGETLCNSKEDINGNMRIIEIESIVQIEAKVYEQMEREVIVDAYSINKKLDVKKKDINITESIAHTTFKETIKETIDVLEEEESIAHVYNANVKPILTDYRIIEGKVIVEGFLDTEILYLGKESGEIKNTKQEIPFKTYVDIEEINTGMDSEIEPSLDNIRFNQVNQQEVEVEAIIKLDIDVNRIKKISILTEAEELPEEIDKSRRPSITIYIVQDGDTIWDIAKRYNTTVEELVTTNEIVNPQNIMPGEKLIIEKDVEFEL